MKLTSVLSRLVIALFVFVALGTTQAQAFTGRIAYIDLEGRLATSAPDGSETRTLTGADLRYQFPAWSPVSDTLAVIGANPGGSGVFIVKDEAGAKPKPLYQNLYEGPIYAYWSPDGRRLGFLSNVMGGLGLNIVPTDGVAEPKTRQIAVGNPVYWQWTQDGQRLLVHNGNNAPAGEVAFYTATGEIGTSIARPGLFNAPGLSADERYLAYAELESGTTKIIVRGSRSGPRVRRAVPYQGLAAFTWSPAGNELAIMSPSENVRTPFGPLRLLDAENGELTTLIDARVLAFFWSPDGKKIAYLTTFQRGDGEMAEVSGRIYQTVQDDPFLLELHVVEVASGEDRLLTTFAPTGLFVDQFLPFFDQYALSHALWSPGSDALVLPMQGQRNPEVVIVPLQGKAVSITGGEMPFWSRR